MVNKKVAMRQLPIQKLYFSISDVSRLAGVKPHVLRYWESEFPELRPGKNRAGNRTYRPKEVKMVLLIKKLLYDERYTIEGARRKLKEILTEDRELSRIEIGGDNEEAKRIVREIRQKLLELNELLG